MVHKAIAKLHLGPLLVGFLSAKLRTPGSLNITPVNVRLNNAPVSLFMVIFQ